ncbi:hypothetical protein [Pedobacter aquatilis]|uniref:WapI family immunity protein n=1 Tax=Pedobacter aquatilis TaxID=351343 RepID=UPI00292D09FF|nr:hypothetical protein [Pedobacter aquatilis]
MNVETTFFEISESGNFIRIDLIGFNHPNSELDWDKNWVKGFVKVRAGGFLGEFTADFMTTDFVSFKIELAKLYDKLNGIATFNTLESQVEIKIVGDGIGHLKAECEVMDNAGTGNKLEFEIDFDQTHIPKILNQLEKITDRFPKVGELN